MPEGTAEQQHLEIGVVVAGAGARGAYEAGLLAHLIPEVASRVQAHGTVARFWFLGTSAGSLNSALIASRAPWVRPRDSPARVRQLWAQELSEVTSIWAGIQERSVLNLWPRGRLVAALTRLVPKAHLPLKSVLNVDPLLTLATDPATVDWPGLSDKVRRGVVGAVAAATTGRDGRTVLFMHRHENAGPIPRDARRDIDYVDVDGLLAQHVLASSAIPSVFPAQRITEPPAWEGWYYDGGVRLNTPLKPALALGLEHLIVVSTHPDAYDRRSLPDPRQPQPEVDEAAIPVVTQIMADQVIQDLMSLRSRNRLPGQRQVRHLFAGPPDFDTIADISAAARPSPGLSWLVRSLLSGRAQGELSSYLLFDPGFLSAEVDAGRARAEALLAPTSGARRTRGAAAVPEVPWQV